jgi:hypothetical protein
VYDKIRITAGPQSLFFSDDHDWNAIVWLADINGLLYWLL